jgi:hypothetical protein
MMTPTEVLAARISELEAELKLAKDDLFYAQAKAAALKGRAEHAERTLGMLSDTELERLNLEMARIAEEERERERV